MTSDLIIVVLLVQTATLIYWNTAPSFEEVPWFAETATDTGAGTVGGGFLTGGYTSRATIYILCIWRTGICRRKKKYDEKEIFIEWNIDENCQ